MKAYERWLHSNPGAIEDELMPGLNATARQLFFLSFGQVWCGSLRPEAAISKMKTAVHAPGRFRYYFYNLIYVSRKYIYIIL